MQGMDMFTVYSSNYTALRTRVVYSPQEVNMEELGEELKVSVCVHVCVCVCVCDAWVHVCVSNHLIYFTSLSIQQSPTRNLIAAVLAVYRRLTYQERESQDEAFQLFRPEIKKV